MNKTNKIIELLKKNFKVRKGAESLLFLGAYFKEYGFDVELADGIIREKHFVPPCIVLNANKKPAKRFNDEKVFLKKYLKSIKKTDIMQTTGHEYFEYFKGVKRNGETEAYKAWRKEATAKNAVVEKLVKSFNKNGKKVRGATTLSILRFEDGTIRLDFLLHEVDAEFMKAQKYPLLKKKAMYKKMLAELDTFAEFLAQGELVL
jgi:hypothetical protein